MEKVKFYNRVSTVVFYEWFFQFKPCTLFLIWHCINMIKHLKDMKGIKGIMSNEISCSIFYGYSIFLINTDSFELIVSNHLFFFIYTSSTFAMSSSQKYTYSDLTDEVHELNDLYKDMQEDNREMNARIISLQQEVRNLTHVIEEHQKVNDDVRNLLNYMSVQGSRK